MAVRRQVTRRGGRLMGVAGVMVLVVGLGIAVSYVRNGVPGWISRASGIQVVNPVKLGVEYVYPARGATSTAIPDQEVAQKNQLVVYARNQMLAKITNYRNAGFKGLALTYLILDAFNGPDSSFASLGGQVAYCNSSQLGYASYSNNTTMDTGDFCEVQNAIVDKTCLKEYPDICPTENWFLHKSDGSRYTRSNGNGTAYTPNQGDPQWRKYLKYRALRELTGGDTVDINGSRNVGGHSPSGGDGIFLDNLELHINKVVNQGSQPKEYASDATYRDAVYGMAREIHDYLHSSGRSYPLWANMIVDNNDGSNWDRFADALEGGMMESFALSWGKGPLSENTLKNQLAQLDRWSGQGKGFFVIVQDDWASGQATFDQYAKYSLAAYLLVTDGTRGYFKVTNYSGSTGQFFEYADYYNALGAPKGAMTGVSGTYRRDFECGSVKLDVTNRTGTFIQTPDCVPGSSSTPTPSPIPPTPTPTPRPTPTPTPTPRPTPTPTPTPRPTPTPTPTPTTIIQSRGVVADAFVSRESRDTNYGTRPLLEIDGDPVKIVYLKFDLRNVAGMPKSVKLRYKVANATNAGSGSKQNVKLVSNTSWSETGITYNNRPAAGLLPMATINGGQQNTWSSVDLTSGLKGKMGNYVSIAIDSSGSDGLDLYSRESPTTDKPYLEIVF